MSEAGRKNTRAGTSLDELKDCYAIEFDRLAGSGRPLVARHQVMVAVPELRLGRRRDFPDCLPLNIPENARSSRNLLLLAEEILPVETGGIDSSRLAFQARKAVTGLVAYLQDSYATERREGVVQAYLTGVYDYAKRQLVYGKPSGSRSPADFYVRGVDAKFVNPEAVSFPTEDINTILSTAEVLGGLVGNKHIALDAGEQLAGFDWNWGTNSLNMANEV